MKVEVLISSAIPSTVHSEHDRLKNNIRKWTRRLLTSCIAAAVTSVFGLAIAAGSMFGLIAADGSLSVLGSLLLAAAFVTLISVAHCCDRLGEIRHEQRVEAFRKKIIQRSR
jgi:hypothetical protein